MLDFLLRPFFLPSTSFSSSSSSSASSKRSSRASPCSRVRSPSVFSSSVREVRPVHPEIIQRNLDVVIFDSGEEPVAAAEPEVGPGHTRLLIGLPFFILVVFWVLSYLRNRNRAAAS